MRDGRVGFRTLLEPQRGCKKEGIYSEWLGWQEWESHDFQSKLWLLVVIIVTLASDLDSAAYSSDCQYEVKVDDSQYVYHVIRVVIEALELEKPIRVYVSTAQKAY